MDWKWSLMKHSHSPLLPFIFPIYTHSPFPFQSHTELHFPNLPSLTHSSTFNLTMSNSNPPHLFPSNDLFPVVSPWLNTDRQNHIPTTDQQGQSVLPHSSADLGGSSYSNFEECFCTAPGTKKGGSCVDGNLGSSEYPTGNRSRLSGLEQLRVVDEPQEENYVEEPENATPKLNMEFFSEEEGENFYVAYAGKIGFLVRKGDKRTLKNGIRRNFVCSRHKSLEKRRKNNTGVYCDARFQITCEKEKWVVSKVILEHTHELSPPNLCTKQADEATFIEKSNISTESRKRPNEVPFDKSKRMKHIGSLPGSQKAEEQKVNTPIDHSIGPPIETIEEADAVFADIDQVTSGVSSQATSSKKPNLSEAKISGAKMTLKKYLHMKFEDLVHPVRKSDVMNAVETLIQSNVLSAAQNSILEELRSNLLIFPSLKKEMSEFQKSIDSRTGLKDYMKQANSKYKNFKTLEVMKEKNISMLEAQLKKMKASKVKLSRMRMKLAGEVKVKKEILIRPNSEFPSLQERKKKAVDASEQAFSSWEDNKKDLSFLPLVKKEILDF